VLDLAAAPVGKTIQIAQAMKNTGVIRAFDIDPTRSKAMRSNLGRCGVTNTIVHVAPGQDAARFEAWADRILLDAPCTGEGVIQRDPRRKRGSLTEYESCAKDQRELMDAAVKALKPGGVLVYSTCTLAPEENELQVQDALESHNLKLEPLPDPLAERAVGPQPLLAGLTRISQHELDPQIQLTRHALPHLNNCLGFYLARFRKGANE
jgi:tRNA (cytosine40_48-C5)-methyltransferase